VVEWIVDTIARFGYGGIFLLMVLENLFPPIPSEVIMPLAGFAAARGDMSFAGVILAGVAGTVVGNLPWYWLGHRLGHERIRRLAGRFGRIWTISPAEVDEAVRWFERHGWIAVFFGRMLPTIRTVISAPAGVARMPMWGFLLFTTMGSLIWIGLLTLAGLLLEAHYEAVADYVDPLSKVVIAGVVLAYVYRLVRGYGKDEGGR
jgi:membrane protein DedA with SNARE-associated domain